MPTRAKTFDDPNSTPQDIGRQSAVIVEHIIRRVWTGENEGRALTKLLHDKWNSENELERRLARIAMPLHVIYRNTALAAMMTHNDAGSTAACLAFVSMLWRLLAMDTPPAPSWWLESYISVAKDLEGDKRYRPRGGDFVDYEGPIWRFVQEKVAEAHRKELSTLHACNSWYSGGFLLETVPCVIYILMRHGHQPEEAIMRAVNDTRDNDTTGAIVGAAVGALHGKDKLPSRWIEKLSGRTTDRDDGKMFELLGQARKEFWE